MSHPSIFELERPVFNQPHEYLDNVKQVSHVFEKEDEVFELTPDQFVNGFVICQGSNQGSLESVSVKLPSIKDVVNYTEYPKEGLVFRFMLANIQNLDTLNILPGTGDLEYRTSQRPEGRLDYYTQGNSIGNQDKREIVDLEHAQFIVRLSEYTNPLGAFMEMYLISSGSIV